MPDGEFFDALVDLKNRVSAVIERMQDLDPKVLPQIYYDDFFVVARDLQDDIAFIMRPENLNEWVDENEIELLSRRVEQLEDDLQKSLS